LLCFTDNGFIEGTELDAFLREFVGSVNSTDVGPEVRQLPKPISSIRFQGDDPRPE
jgi:hypothetical protein